MKQLLANILTIIQVVLGGCMIAFLSRAKDINIEFVVYFVLSMLIIYPATRSSLKFYEEILKSK